MTSSNSRVVGTTAASKALVEDTLCCVQWKSEAGHVGCLTSTFPATSCRVSCKISFDSVSQEAIFRLSVPVALKTSPNNQKTTLFIFIDPQHVSHLQRLVFDDSETTQTCVSDLVARSSLCSSSTDIIALRFLLKQPATVVGPRGTTSIEPRGAGGTHEILECLHSLSSVTNLTVFLPRNETLVKLIGELSTTVSSGVLRSPEISAVATLYRGVGGVDVGALLGAFRQPPTYQEAARTTEQPDTDPQPDVRPPTSVSSPALGKRRRIDKEQEEGAVPTRAWMERVEQQLSDMQRERERERERERSAAPLAFSYTRPVTRSVSARPEVAALDEVRHLLQQMHAQFCGMEHCLRETDARLAVVEQQQRVHNKQQQQQYPPTMPPPNSQQTAGVRPPHELLPPNPALRQQSGSCASGSPHVPWSQFSDNDRLNALEEAGNDDGTVDSDEDAAAAHAQHEASRALAQRRLFADLVTWLGAARSLGGGVGRNVHAHPDERLRTRLAALGRFAGTGNAAAFDACHAWCSALLFYLHGAGADADADAGKLPDARHLMADMAGLARWAHERRRACVVAVEPIRDDFARLGAAARAAATADVVAEEGEVNRADRGRVAMAAYERLRDVFVARVLTLAGDEGR